MSVNQCHFCDETTSVALEEHHVVPRWLDSYGIENDETRIVCGTCHNKLDEITDIIVKELLQSSVTDQPPDGVTLDDPDEMPGFTGAKKIQEVANIIEGLGVERPDTEGISAPTTEVIAELDRREYDGQDTLSTLIRHGFVYKTTRENRVALSKHAEIIGADNA